MMRFQAEAELKMIQLSTRIIEEINEKSTCQNSAGQVKTFGDFCNWEDKHLRLFCDLLALYVDLST